MRTIKQILMDRDGMSAEDAEALIEDAKDDLMRRLNGNGDDPEEICAEWFGIEPDYITELM